MKTSKAQLFWWSTGLKGSWVFVLALALLFGSVLPRAALFAGGASEQASSGSGGQAGGATQRSRPDWVNTPPAARGGKTYFVASGSAGNNDLDTARKAAILDAISQINSYLGTRITVETTGVEKASLDSYAAQVEVQLKARSEGQLEGLRRSDEYFEKRGEVIYLYLLVEYDTVALEAERKRRAELAQEQLDAVAVPEEQARGAEASSKLYTALRFYLQAAQAAWSSLQGSADRAIPNAQVKLQRNLQSALRVLEGLRLELVSGPRELQVGQRPSEGQGFVVRVEGGAEAELIANYREQLEGNRSRQRSVAVTSDSGAVLNYLPPRPVVVGRERVTLGFDIAKLLGNLVELRGPDRELVAALEDSASKKRLNLEYEVVPASKGSRLALLVVEVDQQGRPLAASAGAGATQQGLSTGLSTAGFSAVNAALGASWAQNLSDAELLRQSSQALGSSGGRYLIVVRSRIGSVDDRGADGVIVQVSATVQVIDPSAAGSPAVVVSTQRVANARGNDLTRATSAALSRLGTELADQLARTLP